MAHERSFRCPLLRQGRAFGPGRFLCYPARKNGRPGTSTWVQAYHAQKMNLPPLCSGPARPTIKSKTHSARLPQRRWRASRAARTHK